jgi:hypothetical protein
VELTLAQDFRSQDGIYSKTADELVTDLGDGTITALPGARRVRGKDLCESSILTQPGL